MFGAATVETCEYSAVSPLWVAFLKGWEVGVLYLSWVSLCFRRGLGSVIFVFLEGPF